MKNFYLILLTFCLFQNSAHAMFTDDAGIRAIDSVSQRCPGPNDVYVLIRNFGSNTIDSVYVDWTVNGIPEPSLHYQVALAAGDSVQVFLGVYVFMGGVPHDFQVWTREPNGVPDNDMNNDTLTVTGITTGLSGIYTIGGSSPNFTNFNDAVSSLINTGICGPVEFEVRTGVYIEQVSIPTITGSSALNSITFESELGDSTSVVLTYASATSLADNFTLQLNGVDNIIFRNLTFERSGVGTASGVVEITNESNDVTFSGNQFRGPSGITTSNTDGSRSGIHSPMSYNNNNLRITGNYFKDNACGIWSNGDATSHATGTVVENNVFETFYVGVFLLYQNSPQITGNTLIRNTTTGTIDYYGISIRFTIGPLLISKNKITSYTGNYGIRLRDCVGGTGSEGLVVNNFIQVGGAGISRGISSEDNSGFQFIYNNSVHCTGTSATLGRGFHVDGDSTSNIQLANNIFANSGGGYSIYVTDIAQAGISQSNYNCLYSIGSVGYWDSPQMTLSDFRTASGLEANSVSGDPLFISMNDLHAAAGIVADAAMPLALVQDDIDGELRDALTPDIGADEFMFTGTTQLSNKNAIQIYPNPVTEYVHIRLTENSIREGIVSLKDLSGRTIMLQPFIKIQQNNELSIDLSSVPAGFYLIGIETGEESFFSPLIKSEIN